MLIQYYSNYYHSKSRYQRYLCNFREIGVIHSTDLVTYTMSRETLFSVMAAGWFCEKSS